jgi:hypothetical protein
LDTKSLRMIDAGPVASGPTIVPGATGAATAASGVDTPVAVAGSSTVAAITTTGAMRNHFMGGPPG